MKYFGITLMLLYMLGYGQKVMGQKRLDSIVKYAYTDVGNDSLAIAKRVFDYNGEGFLLAERELYSSDYVHWQNNLRTSYSYDVKGRLKRSSKDSFFNSTSTWKGYFRREREYSSDSDYVVRFYERKGKQFDTVKKYIRQSFFSDGEQKARAKYTYNLRFWLLHPYDSAVKDFRKDAIIKKYWVDGIGYYHFSGPKTSYFRLDSSSYHHRSGSISKSYKITSIPNRVIYISKSEKGEGSKEMYTSDSSVYFISSEGRRDSMHHYRLYWQSPKSNDIRQKVYYLWTGPQLSGIRKYSWYNGKIVDFEEKLDLGSGSGALGKDTVFYKKTRSAEEMEVDFKKSMNIGINGFIRSISYLKLSPTVDSFNLQEKEIYFYSEPATLTPESRKLRLVVFPNPSQGLLNIKVRNKTKFILCDVHGRELREFEITDRGSIHIEEKGLFLLKCTDSGSVVRVLIQ